MDALGEAVGGSSEELEDGYSILPTPALSYCEGGGSIDGDMR